jgi:hypothetical protein
VEIAAVVAPAGAIPESDRRAPSPDLLGGQPSKGPLAPQTTLLYRCGISRTREP